MRCISSLVLIVAAAACSRADSLDDVLDRMDRAAKDFKSFTAKLKRTDYTAVLDESDTMSGTMAMRRDKNGIDALTQLLFDLFFGAFEDVQRNVGVASIFQLHSALPDLCHFLCR